MDDKGIDMHDNRPDLLQLTRAFREPRIILTAVELGFFEALTDKAMTAEQVALQCGVDNRASHILLSALVSIGVLHAKDGVFAISEEYRSQLDPSSPDNVMDGLRHTCGMWRSWTELAATARQGHPGRDRPRPAQAVRSFIGAMRVGARGRADEIAAQIGVANRRRVLDLGGGPGSYAIAFARANPQLTAVVFDLPEVTPIAQEEIDKAEMSERVTTASGDYLVDPLPEGFDLIWVSSIVHMHSPGQNRHLIAKAARSLEPGGRLIVREFLLDEDGLGPASATLFAVNMLSATDAGRSYRASEISGWLSSAGLTNIGVEKGEQDGLVWADKV